MNPSKNIFLLFALTFFITAKPLNGAYGYSANQLACGITATATVGSLIAAYQAYTEEVNQEIEEAKIPTKGKLFGAYIILPVWRFKPKRTFGQFLADIIFHQNNPKKISTAFKKHPKLTLLTLGTKGIYLAIGGKIIYDKWQQQTNKTNPQQQQNDTKSQLVVDTTSDAINAFVQNPTQVLLNINEKLLNNQPLTADEQACVKYVTEQVLPNFPLNHNEHPEIYTNWKKSEQEEKTKKPNALFPFEQFEEVAADLAAGKPIQLCHIGAIGNAIDALQLGYKGIKNKADRKETLSPAEYAIYRTQAAIEVQKQYNNLELWQTLFFGEQNSDSQEKKETAMNYYDDNPYADPTPTKTALVKLKQGLLTSISDEEYELLEKLPPVVAQGETALKLKQQEHLTRLTLEEEKLLNAFAKLEEVEKLNKQIKQIKIDQANEKAQQRKEKIDEQNTLIKKMFKETTDALKKKHTDQDTTFLEEDLESIKRTYEKTLRDVPFEQRDKVIENLKKTLEKFKLSKQNDILEDVQTLL